MRAGTFCFDFIKLIFDLFFILYLSWDPLSGIASVSSNKFYPIAVSQYLSRFCSIFLFSFSSIFSFAVSLSEIF